MVVEAVRFTSFIFIWSKAKFYFPFALIVSELSFQEGSVYNSEMECINLEQQSETEPLDVKLEQADEKSESHYSLPPIAPNVNGQVQASIQPKMGFSYH